ncbi:MAG: DUF4091 domain-containing protein [Armatimonadota bacterium]|nr:DUF4091 domain-containing protein [Armatimonadota bacterium]
MDLKVRRVGYVPVKHLNADAEPEWEGAEFIPGFVPDPLLPENSGVLGPNETHAFWITASIPESAPTGTKDVQVRFSGEECFTEVLNVRVCIHPVVCRPLEGFPVVHWFYADALCDYYGVEPYEERFWHIVRPYMEDVAEHGSGQYVPIFTPPTDGVKRPHQLLKVSRRADGKYEFDFSDVRRWVHLARSCGAKLFEWTHLFTQWGAKHPIRVYYSNRDPSSLLWPPETEATSPVYVGFLSQFLPRFYEFLSSENLLDCSLFHISDEPHGDEHLENYRRARTIIRDLAPWMKTCDAISDVRFARENLTDVPVAIISSAQQFADEGFKTMVYFCCGPRGRYLNRLIDTPLVKIRMSGWLFHKLNAQGFLHWGYNYWYRSQTQELIDPYTEQSGCAWPGWAYGDPFVVYPGPGGPIDSIRWEVFSESLQDQALLRTLGVQPDDEMLADIVSYESFPKDPLWIQSKRRQLLVGLG